MDKETPEFKREKLRQEELNKPSSSINGSNLADLVGSIGWKMALSLILIMITGYLIYAVFFS